MRQQCSALWQDGTLLPSNTLCHMQSNGILSQGGGSSAQRSDSAHAACGAASSGLVFSKAEEECLHAHAKWSCNWRVSSESRYKVQAAQHRVLFCVDRGAVAKAVHQLAQLFRHDVSQHSLE